MNYYYFLDETGDHGLSFVDENFPIFLLCGCLIREDHLEALEKEINDFKKKYFSTTEVILHSRDIHKCNGAFQILFDLGLKARFYKDLNKVLESARYTVIGSAINKLEHIKKYGKDARDPYNISLSFIMERLIFCTDKIDKNSKVKIIVESRGRKENDLLLSHYNSILDRGTFHVETSRFKERVLGFRFCLKKDNVVGSQLADLSAYPLARYVINPDEPYIPFNVIGKKIYSDKKGDILGYGLKIFP
ncbi:MAG: DUF3800 domain-containing protein [Candidatus Omnitrophica bacterium]|nr:DUF3800 domain-containing protein [Candidatus Omnitrophota bacterium]